MGQFQEMTKVIRKCFHMYGVHSVTLQPEIAPVIELKNKEEMTGGAICQEKCQMMCGTTCEELMCCGPD